MRFALAQFCVRNGDVEANTVSMIDSMDKAHAAGADLLVLPEMCTTGMNWSGDQTLPERAESALDLLVAHAAEKGIAFCGSFLERIKEGVFANTFYYYNSGGSLLAKYRKAHLFSLFGEDSQMLAGDEIVTADAGFCRIGCSICYDLRFPELFRKCVLDGTKVQILVAAFPHPRLSHWQSLIRARAIENQVYFVAVNQCGKERIGSAGEEVTYFGHSMVVDPWGEVVFEAGEEPGLFEVELDLAQVRLARERMPALKDRRSDLYE